MRSMTGFGAAEQHHDSYLIGTEIRGYNSRFLEISLDIPDNLTALEEAVRNRIAERVSRGRIEARVYLVGTDRRDPITFDHSNVVALKRALDEICQSLGLTESVSLSHLLHFEKVVTLTKRNDSEIYRSALFEVLEEACTRFETNRISEGAETARDIRRQLAHLEAGLSMIAEQVPRFEAHTREQISRRYHELLNEEIDPYRLQSETALLVLKSSINEELARMKAHIAEFHATLARPNRIGKKLDFICQELQRETNTIASKAPLFEISRGTIEMKEAIENMREQLRNVE